MPVEVSLPVPALEYLRNRVREQEFFAYIKDQLIELVAIDNTPVNDVAEMHRREEACFAICQRELLKWLPHSAKIERQPIRPAIADHPYFTPVHYQATSQQPNGPDVKTAFANRHNLLAVIDTNGGASGGKPCIYNAHIDTVAPHIPPRLEGHLLYGRGAADDKAHVALMIGQLRLLWEVREKFGIEVTAPRVYQIVIEEETGGNGSLSASLDERFLNYAVIILEITSLVAHPANRGAAWYRADLFDRGNDKINLVHMAADVVLAMEEEGAKIKEESKHPLFLPSHVQTCHGIIGQFGDHPSAVNDRVDIVANGIRNAEPIVEQAVAAYVERYGDKTAELDDEGNPKVAQHYALASQGRTCQINIFGKAGHMGAIHLCDCAIIKAAYIIRALADAGGQVELAEECDREGILVMEGGQGLVPTHRMSDVQKRLADAAAKGAGEYCRRNQIAHQQDLIKVSYDKLHNEAYASDVDCPAMQALQAVYQAMGRDWPKPMGWDVSCDARVYARRGHDVVTWGAGQLSRVHRPDEVIDLNELAEGISLSAAFAFTLGGSNLNPEP